MNSPELSSIRLPEPDAAYRLGAEERARVRRFDADALERLLAMIRPDMRWDVLRHFLPRERGERLGWLVKFHDPVLQAVLEEVWAPYWDGVPDELLQIDDPGALPGRVLALQRRMAAADDGSRGVPADER